MRIRMRVHKRISSRVIYILLIVSLVTSSLLISFSPAYAIPSNTNCGLTVSTRSDIPNGVAEYNLVNHQRLNLNLYHTWGIIAYGTTGNLTDDYD